MELTFHTFECDKGSLRVVAEDREWFVAKDVGALLGLSGHPSQYCAKIKAEHKGVRRVDTLGGPQVMLCVDETGLYQLIMRSDKPEAQQFQEWVCGEVLPSIRHTGKYEVQTVQPAPMAETQPDPWGLVASTLQGAMESYKQLQTQVGNLGQQVAESVELLNKRLAHLEEQQDLVVKQTRKSPFVTIVEFSRLRGIYMTDGQRKELGGKAKTLALRRGIQEYRTAPSSKYPRGINRYPLDLVLDAFNGLEV